MTCKGGGVKGVGDIGAIEELERCGVLAQVEAVAGSSAGGLVAILLAIGCTAEEIKQEMLAVDFRNFQDKDEPGWLESTHLKDLAAGGELADSLANKLGILRKVPVIAKVSQKLARLPGRILGGMELAEDVVGLAIGADLGICKGDALSSWLANIIARKTGKPDITFKELELLSKAPGSRFKNLILTGSNITDGVLEYYNAENTPDMPIAKAARISASFPGVYKPVIEVDASGNPKVKVDGGLLENVPDVFNKPPYLTPEETNEFGGNKRAFALLLTDPKSEQPKKIKKGIHLVNAMYHSVLSATPLIKKYGSNVAHIDTSLMGTLEFDASDEKKETLVQAGRLAVRGSLRSILKKESTEEIRYQNTSDEELIRLEFALLHLTKTDPHNRLLAHQLIQIEREIEHRKIPDQTLEHVRKKEEERLLRRQKQTGDKVLNDTEVSELCSIKHKELERIEKELQGKYKQLYLAKWALQGRLEDLLQKFQENNSENDFARTLKALKDLEQAIDTNRKEAAFLLPGIAREQNDEAYGVLKQKRAALLKEAIQQYSKEEGHIDKKTVSPNLESFFKDIEADINNPHFIVPATVHELTSYCSHDIATCSELMQECKQEIKETKNDLQSFNSHQAAFLERKDRGERYELLSNLKNELDKSIYRRTGWLTKCNQFLLRKAPTFGKIMMPLLQGVGILSFIAWLPLSLPAVGIAKLIEHFSKDKNVRKSCENIVDFFRPSNLYKDKTLRGFRKTTADFIKTMSDTYTKGDKSKDSHLEKLFSIYMEEAKKKGIKTEDLFPRRPEEYQKEAYQDRIRKIERKLHLSDMQKPAFVPHGQGWIHPIEDFKESVVKDVLKIAENDLARLEDISQNQRMNHKTHPQKENQMNKRIQAANCRLMHVEYIQSIERKIAEEQVLEAKEVLEYAKSKEALHESLSPDFVERYGDRLSEMEQRQEIYEFGLKQYKEDAEAQKALGLFMKERRGHHLNKEHGKLVEAPSKHKKRPKPKPLDLNE